MGKLDDFITEARSAGHSDDAITAFIANDPDLAALVSEPPSEAPRAKRIKVEGRIIEIADGLSDEEIDRLVETEIIPSLRAQGAPRVAAASAAAPPKVQPGSPPAGANSPAAPNPLAPAPSRTPRGEIAARLAERKRQIIQAGGLAGEDVPAYREPTVLERYRSAMVTPVVGAIGGLAELATGAVVGGKELAAESLKMHPGIVVPGVPGSLSPQALKKGFEGFQKGAGAAHTLAMKGNEFAKQAVGVPPEAVMDAQDEALYTLGTFIDPTMLLGKGGKTAKATTQMARLAETTTPPAAATPVERVTEALKRAKPVRAAQEKLYTKERGKRIAAAKQAWDRVGGEEGFRAAKGEMKGELPKAEFESILKDLKETDVADVFNQVRDSDKLSDFEKLHASEGLARLFGEAGGGVPQRSQLALLQSVFGTEFVDAALGARSMWSKVKTHVVDALNVPRAIMASVDLSAPMRQGLFLIGRPRQFFGAFGGMVKSFGSKKAYTAIEDSIRARPSFDLMQESGLSLTRADGKLGAGEEAFAGANLAEKIPLLGRAVGASNRAYSAFLNKLRADVFDDLTKRATDLGQDLEKNYQPHLGGGVEGKPLAKEIAEYINAATGRGDFRHVVGSDLGDTIHKADGLLNAVFFSPKLMASRLTLLNPAYYISRSPLVRKQALRDLSSTLAFGATVAGLAVANGAKVGTEPRSSDFGKIIVGDTRVDTWGGFQQYVRMIAQLSSGQYVSATDKSGLVKTLGEDYGKPTRLDILYRQVESKEAPIFSLATALLRGKDYRGMPVELKKEIATRFAPMILQDAFELYQTNPEHLPLMGAALFGVGVQNFSKGTDAKSLKKELDQLRRAKQYVIKKGDPATRAEDLERINAATEQVRAQLLKAREKEAAPWSKRAAELAEEKRREKTQRKP